MDRYHDVDVLLLLPLLRPLQPLQLQLASATSCSGDDDVCSVCVLAVATGKRYTDLQLSLPK